MTDDVFEAAYPDTGPRPDRSWIHTWLHTARPSRAAQAYTGYSDAESPQYSWHRCHGTLEMGKYRGSYQYFINMLWSIIILKLVLAILKIEI